VRHVGLAVIIDPHPAHAVVAGGTAFDGVLANVDADLLEFAQVIRLLPGDPVVNEVVGQVVDGDVRSPVRTAKAVLGLEVDGPGGLRP
jgi:hypothetical protein